MKKRRPAPQAPAPLSWPEALAALWVLGVAAAYLRQVLAALGG